MIGAVLPAEMARAWTASRPRCGRRCGQCLDLGRMWLPVGFLS